MKPWKYLSILTLLAVLPAGLLAQPAVDLVFQTDGDDDYELLLFTQEAEYLAQLDSGVEPDAARMALILIKLARIELEAANAAEQISAGSDEIDAALADLAGRIGDGFSDVVVEPDDDARGGNIEARIDSATGDIDAALEDFADVLNNEIGDLTDLAADLLDSDGPFEVTFQIEGNGTRTAEAVTITRDDLEQLADAIGEGITDGQSLVALVGHLRAATDAWIDAVDWLDIATSADDNQVAIDAMRSGLTSLDSAFVSLQTAFDAGPLDLAVDTEDARALVADMDDILAGRTFAIGDRTVRPVALIESRTSAAYRSLDGLQPALLLSRLAQREFHRAEQTGAPGDLKADGTRAERARTRGWALVMVATGAMGLSDKAPHLLLEMWTSETPAEETLRGYFPDGLSDAMLEVLDVDLVVNSSASTDETDEHMRTMRADFEARIAQDPADAEARAGLALVRTYFLVSDNHQNVFDVLDMAIEGDVVGIVERFDTEDFDYAAALDSTEHDIDVARDDAELVFLIVDKMDADGNPFELELDDDIVALPFAGDILDLGLDVLGAVASAATALAQAGVDALAQMEDSLELDLDPNELDFTDSDSALDIALALEVSNPDFLRMSPEGASNMVDLGERIEDALDELAGAVSDARELTADLEGEGADLRGIAAVAEDFDEFYGDMHEDFSNQPTTTKVAGEEVDMSAWFDHPPTQMLQQFIWFLDDDDQTDNTLAGLLPGRRVQSVVHEDHSASLPDDFALSQNYPNPFNSGTVIGFSLPVASHISLRLYDLLGQEVLRLSEGQRAAGSYRVFWDGTDANGQPLATGTYYYRLRAGEQVHTQRLLLLR